MLDNQSRWFRVYGKREASRPRVNEKTRAEWFGNTRNCYECIKEGRTIENC